MQTTQKQPKKLLPRTIIIGFVMALIIGAFSFYAVADLNKGMVEVAANQQDAYVQLVIDQVKLKENRNDEEIIDRILNSLDASTNRYWAFSRDKDMLFVRDVMETNRYKGFTADTFFGKGQASTFYDQLDTKKVKHETIEFDGQSYVASGSAFEYNGSIYRLLLLTNEGTLLENNSIMGARARLVVLIAVLAGIALLTVLLIARKADSLTDQLNQATERNVSIQRVNDQLIKELKLKNTFDSRRQLWNDITLPQFTKRFFRQGASLICAKAEFDTRAQRNAFLENASILLDSSVFRFEQDGDSVLLLFVNYTIEQAKRALEPLSNMTTDLHVEPMTDTEEVS